MVTDPHTGTRVHEIADGIYRINSPVALPGGQAFSFNQYLVVDDEPLLFHTGPRQLFAAVRDAMAAVMPVERLRYVGLSHVEADECGSMNLWLQAAPAAVPLCGSLAAMVSMNDLADRTPRALADGETLRLGRHELQWFDTPHVPHGWECGLAMERSTRTFFCGDLLTQAGEGAEALIERDILGPSEAFRQAMDYYAHAPHTRETLLRLAGESPGTLACMHGSAWRTASLGPRLARSMSASAPSPGCVRRSPHKKVRVVRSIARPHSQPCGTCGVSNHCSSWRPSRSVSPSASARGVRSARSFMDTIAARLPHSGTAAGAACSQRFIEPHSSASTCERPM